MILIKSIDRDVSTDDVIRWLLRHQAPFLRLNNITTIRKIEYLGDRFIAEFDDGVFIDLKKVNAYWYRRGGYSQQLEIPQAPYQLFNEAYRQYILEEHQGLKEFFITHLRNYIPSIGDSISCVNVNKNAVLSLASDCSLLTPDFIITTEKQHALRFLQKHKRIITKGINSSFMYAQGDSWFPTYTEEVTPEHLEQIPARFEPTLFQQLLAKKLEVRAFYLEGDFYSMAIFSQNDSQTRTDFRVYNHERPNRNVPFRLPAHIELSLHKLMKMLKFESGSIDLVLTPENQFYFLEVNPVGQFGMVSYPCNYRLEQKMAEALIRKSNGRHRENY